MSESNDNFNELKRLLKLKQHEVPPPGYFNHFSGDVLSRIQAGESGSGQNLVEKLQSNWPFLAAMLRIFDARPGVIGGLATSVCLLLLIAVVVADRSDEASTDGMMASASASSSDSAAPALASAPLVPAGDSGIAVSTNPVVSLQAVASLFGSQQNPLFQPAAFMPAGQ